MASLQQQFDFSLPHFQALYDCSISRPAAFWQAVWEFTGIRGVMGERVVEHGDRMPAARFSPDARLNFAENLLGRSDRGPAIVFNGENPGHRTMSALEQRRDEVLRDHPIVVDPAGDALVRTLEVDRHLGASGAVLDRIADQVREHLEETVAVAV